MKVKLRPATVFDTASLVELDGQGELVGEGSTDYVCSGCDRVLASKAHDGMLSGVRLRCPDCGAINKTAPQGSN